MKMVSDNMQDKKQKVRPADSDESFQGIWQFPLQCFRNIYKQLISEKKRSGEIYVFPKYYLCWIWFKNHQLGKYLLLPGKPSFKMV